MGRHDGKGGKHEKHPEISDKDRLAAIKSQARATLAQEKEANRLADQRAKMPRNDTVPKHR